ncbi:uncharacterized protein MONBRDRAFT_14889 [Monosiga brevicollis MX1]|uniref:sphinganine-1-phosphate aldolase n=1 Tax=Monosiga brevicollis TaxID=81824 RepID=A9UT87_MONBE|nr:uncharacterized protein MONBRDRAFT_14889 [Monosiga brevicollis MX1]EDQ91203.1 predicted protein [Monosiga brevicollis MX1]|eukprot:XP_001743625.1 hypothetical protein [Monosiga brevicollis MX1]
MLADDDAESSNNNKAITIKTIPEKGMAPEEILKEMEILRNKDVSAEDGSLFAFVYDAVSAKLLEEAYDMFAHENGLNPIAFPSLRQFETEVISMTASMCHAAVSDYLLAPCVGTESILCAIKAYRDRARKLNPSITEPEIASVAPITVHPAFNKAAAYFNLKMVLVPVDENGQAQVEAVKKAITRNTVLLVMSAPQYPHGVVDPVEAVAAIALRKGLPLHVDACFGGFMLPWVEKLGYPVPTWDFRVNGVTSISADIHKYGWGAKGASVLLFRNAELRSHLFYAYADWPGGLFVSPSLVGTRPGGYIAASWATLKFLGQEGYMAKAKAVMETTEAIKRAVGEIEGIKILGTPHMTGISIVSASPQINVLILGDMMEKRGWKLEMQQNPSSLHLSIMPHHVARVQDLVADLRELAMGKKADDEGMAAMYGMTANIPDSSIVSDFLAKLMSDVYTCRT